MCIGLTGYDLDQNNSLSRGGQREDPGTRPLSKHAKWSEGGGVYSEEPADLKKQNGRKRGGIT